jgi:hypothetical protein
MKSIGHDFQFVTPSVGAASENYRAGYAVADGAKNHFDFCYYKYVAPVALAKGIKSGLRFQRPLDASAGTSRCDVRHLFHAGTVMLTGWLQRPDATPRFARLLQRYCFREQYI